MSPPMYALSRDELALLARASFARRAIKDGLVDPWDGLFFVLCPPPEMVRREQEMSRSLLYSRAYHAAKGS